MLLLFATCLSCSVNSKLAKELARDQKDRNDLRGMVVYDLTRDRELLNYNGNKYFIPASTVKLFTFYTAYSILPDSVLSLEYLERGDSLVIRGAADPSVLLDEEDRVVEFLKTWKEKIFLVDSSIEDSKYGPGWSWDDYESSYMPERSLMPLYGNLLTLTLEDSLRVVPEFFRESLSVEGPDTEPSGRKNSYRDMNRNRFYPGKLERGEQKSVPFITSNQLTADLLGEAIGKKVTLVPADFEEDFENLLTRSYDSLYTQMLVESDNFIAEQLMLQIGSKVQNEYRVKSAIEYALDSLVNDVPQRPRWVDGSGLSRYNLFTPESMIYLLKKMHHEIPANQLLGYLAQGGVSGTLEGHFKGPFGEPYVFAKSGSLSNNYCLSGYLKTKKGRLLAFSFMDNHYRGASGERKKELENFLLRLREAN
jgi:D-alanyl-D-alanine carboxypeptidase/D-alanyl-D-alanine-endopeptidase (penicillin-binding protein 4)